MTTIHDQQQHVLDGLRGAIAMAIAGERDDTEAIGALWNQAPDKRALLWSMARLPSVLVRDRDGITTDVEGRLRELLDGMPHHIDDMHPNESEEDIR